VASLMSICFSGSLLAYSSSIQQLSFSFVYVVLENKIWWWWWWWWYL